MAILFDDASTEYLEVNSPPATAAPFSMACWFRSDSVALTQGLMSICDKDAANHIWGLRAAGATGGDPVQLSALAGGAAASASTSSGYSANTWHHACGVETSSTSRAAFIDGGSKGTDTTSRSPAGADRISIAREGLSTPQLYLSGDVAEAAVWNVALTDAEVASLGQGFSPLFIRPQSLVFYLPMISLVAGGTQRDWIGARGMVENNTPATSAHPPKIIYPSWIMRSEIGFPSIGSALSGSLRMTGGMMAIPLSATYQIYSSDVPRRTFSSN